VVFVVTCLFRGITHEIRVLCVFVETLLILSNLKRESGEVMRDTTFGGGAETISRVFKVPRQCPLVHLVEVMRMNGINFI
jgi:hypothetical protein